MGTLINHKDLLDGDILIYQGSGWISKAIKFFTNSEVSHAALYLAEEEVIESIAVGVIKQGLGDSIEKTDKVSVHRLNNRPQDMSPVTKHALTFLGDRYGYEQLLLLALICTFRKIRMNNAVAKFVRKVLESAGSIVLEYTNGNKEALICSELVFRSYDEAVEGYNDPYTLYLQRDNQLKMSATEFANFATFPQVSEESIFSNLYGVNNSMFFNRRIISPFVETKSNTFEFTKTSVDEFETLFDDVVNSYLTEDYVIDDAEIVKLKDSMDKFVKSNYSTKKNVLLYKLDVNPGEIIKTFLHDNANFVTPADLYNCKNLQMIGFIK